MSDGNGCSGYQGNNFWDELEDGLERAAVSTINRRPWKRESTPKPGKTTYVFRGGKFVEVS